ncbi:MAG: nickel pincer cofactor biosynthesis protein LarB [Nitrospirota bacterium]|jgi:NCAIR mutase (PurE)-related protein
MDSRSLKAVLRSVKSGKLDVEEALRKLRDLPYEDITCAKVDHHRHLRQGIPEVVMAEGKKTEEVAAIARAIYKKSGRLLITRAREEVFKALKIKGAKYHERSGAIAAGGARARKGNVLVVSAGTSDAPAAEEASVTAEFLGSRVSAVSDVGVAGIHRIMDQRKALAEARVIIVVAGMEGALPSVVGGLTDRPILAVPTSTGYGTSLGGLTALFSMLNSCVPGIAVMNIDNGFGAGCLAHRINVL